MARRLAGWRSLALAVACCGPAVSASAFAAPKTHTVVIEAMQFSPAQLEIAPGDSVVWVNKDPFPHNVKAIDGSLQSKEIAASASWKSRFIKKGPVPYICTLHPTMKASLIVK